MSKPTKSLAYNTAKKRKIIIGCAIGGTAVLMAGAGIGIGYAIKKNIKQDIISFKEHRASLNWGETMPIDATSSLGRDVTIDASGDQEGKIWTFHDNNLSYKEAIPETEPIAVTITATDGTTQQQTKIALLSPERIPEDAFHIKSVINDDCLVNDGEPIYTSSLDAGDPDHNVLLNLSKFKEVEHITTDDFVIDGIVNFGILVGFDENINLYGSSGSLMNITTTNVETYGIIVGSESPPEADHDSYTGKMYISHSVSCNISASATAYGVWFNSTATDSTQIINGVFTISSSANAYGVRFYSVMFGNTTIDGVFDISSSEANFAVEFNSTFSGNTIINGIFTVLSSKDAHGVSFFSTASGDITINGTFTVSADGNSLARGVEFSFTVSGGVTINGIFTVSSPNEAFGVDFHAASSYDVISSKVTINGIFTISCSDDDADAYGVRFLSDISGDITINGVFTISSSGAAADAYGVHFNSIADSTQTINGIFTISSSANAYGVYFDSTVSGELLGIPKFYSNKVDSGDWISKGKSEYWNGVLCDNSTAPSDDSSLELQSVYDTPTDDGANFHVDEISVDGTEGSSLTNFNTALRDALQNYVDQSYPSIATSWLNAIIDRIIIEQ